MLTSKPPRKQTETAPHDSGQPAKPGPLGPRGHYLGQPHTRRHIRKLDFSDLTAQPREGGGYRDPIEVASEKTECILENHHPQPLAEEQRAELDQILQAAERELGS